MSSPPKRREPRAGGSQRESGQQARRNITPIPSRKQGGWSVVIAAGNRCATWDRGVCREYAEHVARQLREHGFDARVEQAQP